MNNNGVTIVETIVYILIIGIIMAIAIPSFSMVNEYKLISETRKLLSDIRQTKNLTTYKGISHNIAFSKEGYEISDNSGRILKTYKFSKGIFLKNYLLNKGTQKVNYMTYTSYGMASSSGTLVIGSENNTYEKRISITPVMGRPAIIG